MLRPFRGIDSYGVAVGVIAYGPSEPRSNTPLELTGAGFEVDDVDWMTIISRGLIERNAFCSGPSWSGFDQAQHSPQNSLPLWSSG